MIVLRRYGYNLHYAFDVKVVMVIYDIKHRHRYEPHFAA